MVRFRLEEKMQHSLVIVLFTITVIFAQQNIPYPVREWGAKDDSFTSVLNEASRAVVGLSNRLAVDGNTTLIAHLGNGYCQGVTVVDSIVYFGNGVYLEIVDMSNPDSLVQLGNCIISGLVDIAVRGSYAYLASGDDSLYIIDVANPANPVEVGQCHTNGQALGIAVNDRFALVAALGGGLRIIDISDPTAPQEIGSFTGQIAVDVTLSGNYAYVAAGAGGLRIIDITTPASPVEVSYYEVSGTANGVALSGNYVYLAVTNDGLRIIDVTDPTAPQEVGYWYNGGPLDVAVREPYAYVAAGNAGLQIIDVTNPADPLHVGYYDTPSVAEGVAVTGSYACVADFNDGLYIIRNDLLLTTQGDDSIILKSFALHQNYPNPFNPSTTIRYDLRERAQVSLVIYDLLGREVRQLVNSVQESGYKTIIWDGKDAQGQRVPAGVYLYRLKAGDFVQTRKLAVLK
jgi:hypothetical protein